MNEAADRIEQEARRLFDANAGHFDRLLGQMSFSESDDGDTAAYGVRQRGNASAYSYTDGLIAGLCRALRTLGNVDRADQIEHDLEEALSAIRVTHGFPA